jgi:hypothetical protein
MRSRILILAIASIAVATTITVSARSKKVTLTIHSTPEGALLTENGKLWGATPFALVYNVGDFRACQNTPPVSVRWASGAGAAVPWIALCPAVGTNQVFTLERPADADGLAVDLQVAYQQAMLAQMRAQTSALNEANYEAWLQTLNASQRAAAAPKPFALCISRDVVRGVVYIACQ